MWGNEMRKTGMKNGGKKSVSFCQECTRERERAREKFAATAVACSE
jgi:hypothetical protein